MDKYFEKTRTPKVSVIISVYNMENYLEQCLDSIVSQTLSDIEIICVDDKSEDSSLIILEKYQEKDSRIKVIPRGKRGGAGAARNAGIEAAKGKYLSVLDADDFFEPDMLEELYKKAEETKSDITICRVDEFDQKSKKYKINDYSIVVDKLTAPEFSPEDISDRIFNISCGWAWDKLFKRNFVEKHGVRFQEIRTTNDMFFVYFLYTCAKKISIVDKVLAHHRVNVPYSLSVTRERSWDNVYLALKALKDSLMQSGKYELYKQSFANWAINLIIWHLRTLNKEEADILKEKCRTEYFNNLDLLNLAEDYFYNSYEYQSIVNISEGLPKVSVIIPVYNASDYIRACLDSVCGQTLSNIEIICVDDGSTDGSLKILKEYEYRDYRIKVFTKEHSNAGDARNLGIEKAVGEYFSFLDADDFFESEMLESVYDTAKAEKADICMFRSDQFEQSTNGYKETPWTLKDWEMPQHRPFSPSDVADKVFNMSSCTAWDKLFRRDFIFDNCILFQSNYTSNDMLFTFTAIACAERISTVEKVLAHQRTGYKKTLAKDVEYCTSCFAQALLELKASLTQRDIYDRYKKSFVNWALDFSLFNMNIYKGLFSDLIRQQLKLRYFEELGIYGQPEDAFYNRDQYAQMLDIMSERSETDGIDQAKVSIIIPVYNVEEYLALALDSVIYQTLEEVEIICVNDGSTDGSSDILNRYAAADKRITVISGENNGYGYAMNRGIKAATGEYIGILEPDDFVDVNMFKDLYEVAVSNSLDFVKSDFSRFTHDDCGRMVFSYNRIAYEDKNYDRIICPRDEQKIFTFIMNTWSGIYKRSFLEEHNISHNETPGASFQDNGFWFKTNMYADRAMFFGNAYYMNRRDNPNSSVKDRGKVYCANQEYALIYEYLEKSGEKEKFLDVYILKLIHNYMFTLDRIAPELKKEYICNISKEFRALSEKGEFKSRFWSPAELNNAMWIKNDPEEFYYLQVKHEIKVSVILPVYNGERYLRQCLDSLLNQSLREIEIICINDGSTDSSSSILKMYASKDARLKIIDQDNAGAGAARNKGIAIATGEYLSFLDADDFFDKDMLKLAYQRCLYTKADICIYKAFLYDELTGTQKENTYSIREEQLPGRDVFSHIDMNRSVFHSLMGWAWDKLYRRSFVLNNNLRFQEQRTTNDMYFVFVSLFKASRITILKNYLYYQRRNNPDSLSNSREISWECFYYALKKVRDELIYMGLYEQYERDFINYALHSCLWNLNTLKEPVKEKLFHRLRNSWFDEFCISGKKEEYFDNKEEYSQYKNIIKYSGSDRKAYLKYKGELLRQRLLYKGVDELKSIYIKNPSGEIVTLKELIEKSKWENKLQTVNEAEVVVLKTFSQDIE